MAKTTILVCGPPTTAVGGGPTHIRNLLASPLAQEFRLELFETGSRGRESPARDEPPLAALVRLVTSPFALAARIVRSRPAVVHLNTSVDPRGFWREVTHVPLARLLGCRVLYQIHGGSLERLASGALMRALVRAVYRWPDAFVVLATSEREAFAPLGVHRLTVIANATDVTPFQSGPPREHSGRVQRLAYLGRLVDGKGLFEAIEAVATLRRTPGFEAVELHLAGSGDARERLAAEIERHGLAGAVRLAGSLAGAEKVAFLREADVLLLPSRSEGLPYSLIEGMACGTPIVASRVGGIPDIVHDGVHGRLVPPGDAPALVAALRELAASPERLRTMSRACSAWAASELGLPRLSRQFGALYRELGAVSRVAR
jgi:glycosyltransferase involved in cell wall biosynthesis